MWQTLQTALTPYIFSPLTVLLCLLAAGGWVLGARRLARQGRAPSMWRTLSFFTGLLLCYAVILSTMTLTLTLTPTPIPTLTLALTLPLTLALTSSWGQVCL